jgi:hypothetical protein
VLSVATASSISAYSSAGDPGADHELAPRAEDALKRSIAYYHSIAVEGGYVYHYSLDLKRRWGEGAPMDHRSIEVQPPGTPAVGMSFLRAFEVLDDPAFLAAARDAGRALIRGQNDLGGWDHKIHFDQPKDDQVSFDDDQTQSAIRFLMALDQVVDDPTLERAIEKSLAMMLDAQMDHGGWPHKYPTQHNYHDFATYDDRGITDCLSVMLDAHRYYGRPEYLESVRKTGWFIILSQLPPPQPGWAQQYNQFLQPAWARSFEPPSVCPVVTVRNVHVLMDLYIHSENDDYLEPIPDAFAWVESTQLPNGLWPRFVEIGTGRALYYDRGRIRVDSVDELSLERRLGYGYETDLSEPLREGRERFDQIRETGLDPSADRPVRDLSADEIAERLDLLRPKIVEIIESLDDQGRWIVRDDRFKVRVANTPWQGEWEVSDRLSSALFNRNVETLCQYLELTGADR